MQMNTLSAWDHLSCVPFGWRNQASTEAPKRRFIVQLHTSNGGTGPSSMVGLGRGDLCRMYVSNVGKLGQWELNQAARFLPAARLGGQKERPASPISSRPVPTHPIHPSIHPY